MKKMFSNLRVVGSLMLGVMLLGIAVQTASAEILFQDDTFATIESDAIMIGSNDAGVRNTGIQFGADATAANNGNIQWNISTHRFGVDHPVDVTGDLTTTNGLSVTGGLVDFHSSSGDRLRESSSPNTLAACATLNEVIVDTTAQSIKLCTTTGAAGVAVWTAPSPAVPTGAANPGTCAIGQLFFNTTSATLQVCTASNTWGTAGPQDFESVYAKDADKTLTTSNGAFTIATGSGAFGVTSTGATSIGGGTIGLTSSTGGTTISGAGTSSFSTSAGNLGLTSTAGNLNLTGGGAANNAINLNASNAAGGITGTWGTGGLNFSSATGAFSITGTGNSTDSAANGNLTLSTTGATGGNVALATTGTGNTVTFKDANLTAPIKFNNSQTALSATYTGAGDTGILDALNGLTTAGSATQGDNLVGFNNTGFTNITGTTVQAALASIDSKIGHNASKIDSLLWNPQYPNYVIAKSGTNNSGTLVEDYDATNKAQFYGWTTNQATLQNIDVKFRFVIPTDFASIGNFTLQYLTGTVTTTNNKVDVKVTDVTKSNTLCGSSLTNASAATWATATITAATLNAGCTGATAIAAGDVMEVDTTLYDIAGATTYAEVGQAAQAYTN
jgi:hypothetical protein